MSWDKERYLLTIRYVLDWCYLRCCQLETTSGRICKKKNSRTVAAMVPIVGGVGGCYVHAWELSVIPAYILCAIS